MEDNNKVRSAYSSSIFLQIMGNSLQGTINYYGENIDKTFEEDMWVALPFGTEAGQNEPISPQKNIARVLSDCGRGVQSLMCITISKLQIVVSFKFPMLIKQ